MSDQSDVPRDPRDLRTKEDIANGWSFEDWLQYHKEREQASSEKLDWNHPSRRKRPDRANGPGWNFPATARWTIRRRGNR